MSDQREAFWSTVSELDGVTVIDPRPALSAYEREVGRTVWRKLDTHWAPEGAAVFSSLVAATLDPALGSPVVPGPLVQADGDLSSMLGATRSEEVVSATVERDGVTLRQGDTVIAPSEVPSLQTTTALTVTASTTGAPLLPGRTLVFGDSYFEAARSQMAPFFENLTYMHNMAADAPEGLSNARQLIAESDTVVIEMVERAAVGGYVSIQRPENVDALVEAMTDNPRR